MTPHHVCWWGVVGESHQEKLCYCTSTKGWAHEVSDALPWVNVKGFVSGIPAISKFKLTEDKPKKKKKSPKPKSLFDVVMEKE